MLPRALALNTIISCPLDCRCQHNKFLPSKPLGCFGDGGAIFTNNNELADKIMQYQNMVKKEDITITIGKNSRLDTIQAAVLIEKFKI